SRAKLQNIFQSPTAHQSVYERMLERNSDEIKISECAETFLTLLHAMEDRYRHVPYPSCTLRLFSLQVDLLDQFLNDLKDCLHNEQQDIDPLSKYFCSILNSIVYVADVIQQWKDRSVRIHIFFYRTILHCTGSFKRPVKQKKRFRIIPELDIDVRIFEIQNMDVY
ncbi:unnamed protein product, partial [Rotaria magnacalcarata]